MLPMAGKRDPESVYLASQRLAGYLPQNYTQTATKGHVASLIAYPGIVKATTLGQGPWKQRRELMVNI